MPGSSDLARFTPKVYASEQVPPACLLLHEYAEVDVNLLLFSAFAAAGRRAELDAAALVTARDAVAAWHSEVVKALRALRLRLKGGPPPGPTAATEAVRDKLKKVEIESELIELDTLSVLADVLPAGRGGGRGRRGGARGTRRGSDGAGGGASHRLNADARGEGGDRADRAPCRGRDG